MIEGKRLALGTFLGVFTPAILTILGVILFLRLGWVVGNAGLGGTLVIVLLSNGITLLTALSLSALATNMRVGIGGAYFLISRTVGLEVGGAIGIPLFLSQVLSVTLYCYGLAEALLAPWDGAPRVAVAALAGALVLGVGAVANRSTELTLKVQLPIMALIGASILSLLLGVDWGGSRVPAVGPWEDAGFWGVFAVFFPAVTGILAGVSLSGDLADPGRSIPRGVLAAVGTGLVVYLVLPFALANGAPPEALDETMVWTRIAWLPWLVVPGLLGAILSSAFGSILSAPRTLQALSHDGLAPASFAEVDPATGEPTRALWLSTGVAFLAVLLGDLNAVAAVLTMFFLTTYGTLNLVAAIEGLVGDPGFRPRIRVHWALSLLGALGCLVAMFAIHPLACAVAIIVEVGIYWTLRRRSLEAAFGDVRGGMLLSSARYALMRLRDARMEARSWRPHILVLTTDAVSGIETIRLADGFGQHRGIVTVTTLVLGDVEDHPELPAQTTALRRFVQRHGVEAFCEAVAVPDLADGVLAVAQAHGFAGLESNTVVFAWPEDGREVGLLLGITRKLALLERCTLIHRHVPGGRGSRIVVWWKGLEHNGDLMLLLAHLLTYDPHWHDARIVLRSVAETAEEARQREAEFADLLPAIRIDADVEVVVRPPGGNVADLLRAHSRDARLVFLGMRIAAAGEEEAYGAELARLVEGLPSTVLVRNAGPFRGRLV